MNRLTRMVTAVLAGALVLSTLGCSARSSERPSEAPTSVPAPRWQPIANGDTVTEIPDPLPEKPDLGRIKALRTGAHDRRAGEQFALAVAQLLTDVRLGASGRRVLDALASEELPPAVRAYLVEDIDDQQAARTQRRFETSAGFWLRSRSIGPPDAPDRLEVEVAGLLASDPLRFHAWHRERYDVAWSEGRWSLVGYSTGDFGPDDAVSLSAAQRREFLPGSGWRYVPPAD